MKRDTMTFAGAHDLAATIRMFWAGHTVRVWVDAVSYADDRGPLHCVRSDLVDGLPNNRTDII